MTLTPDLNPIFSVIFLIGFLLLVVTEIVGVIRKQRGDTITEHWNFVDRVFKQKAPAVRWIWRVFTAGFFIWLVLHFLVGTS